VVSDETTQFVPTGDEIGPPGSAAQNSPADDPAALVAVGIGGSVELAGDRLRLVKGGVFGHLVELLWLGHGVLDNSIAIERITAVEIVETMLMPSFIRFSYAGSPAPTGHFLGDALAENALVMNLIDNRGFYRVKERIEHFRGAPPAAGMLMLDAQRTTA
jgi:hypothetical protein